MNAKIANRVPKIIIALWLAAMIFGIGYQSWKEVWLTADGKQMPATLIVQGHGMKPGIFVYEYTISGVQYNGECRPGENARLGDQILVFVSASHPSFSSFEIPNFSLLYTLIPIALLLWIEFYLVNNLIRPADDSSKTRA